MVKMTRKHNDRRQAGFSLIEVCIGLIILGLIAAALVVPYDLYRKNKLRTHNETNFEAITTALASYARNRGCYPCPARRNLGEGAAQFGEELPRTAGNCTACTTGGGTVGVAGIFIGSVPVRALSLPYKMMEDSFGGQLTYAVSNTVVQNAAAAGAITVQVEGGAAVTNVPFVLVSHGPDLKGARLMNGNAAPTGCAGGDDQQNCDLANATFRDADFSPQNNVLSGQHYDDMIAYTLIRKETSMWRVAGDGSNISNRNLGFVGVGEPNPGERLHIRGGNLEVPAGSFRSDSNITATNDVTAGQMVRAGRFQR